MQTSTGNTSDKGTGVPPQEDREEDSGLHDIRSMASSAKMRISSKRITTSPPVDDDILASSSAGWKAVALPEPAKMVSLPEIEQPAEGSERKSKKELKAERTSASKIAKEAIAVETSAAISPSTPVSPVSIDKQADVSTAPIIGARFAKRDQKSKSKAGLYALIGTGIAAAAGVGWYVSTQMGGAKDSAQQVASVSAEEASKVQAQSTPAAAPVGAAAGSAAVVTPIEPPAAAPEPAADTTVATGMATTEAKEDGADENAAADKGSKRGAKVDAKKKAKDTDEKATDKKVEPPKEPAPKQDASKKENTSGEGEPSFDALLKEAGVENKKPVKVALEKKSLSGADIKKGMSAVAGKAQACYAGTQGTAQVKLTVKPDGTVEKVTVTGVFAGTPVGACVTSAVKGASFPAWDGGPQSFGYSYLLAE